jgi:hypothetical protein
LKPIIADCESPNTFLPVKRIWAVWQKIYGMRAGAFDMPDAFGDGKPRGDGNYHVHVVGNRPSCMNDKPARCCLVM